MELAIILGAFIIGLPLVSIANNLLSIANRLKNK